MVIFATIVKTLTEAVMGLFVECEFCHRFLNRIEFKRHNCPAGAKARAHAEMQAKKALAKKSTTHKLTKPAEPAPNSPGRQLSSQNDPRIIKAEKAQQARRAKQGELNRKTALYETRSELAKVHKEKLESEWQSKLGALKSRVRSVNNYDLQLQSVPPRNATFVNAPFRNTPAVSQQLASPGNDAKQLAQFPAQVACPCGGDNERCYRCDGRGYYEVSAAKAAKLTMTVPRSAKNKMEQPATFASDGRGSAYGLRERGRFTSTPIHDNYDDESSS